ncbi:hypothetical protein LTR66_013632, partial [Elasticomyces elasticus]
MRNRLPWSEMEATILASAMHFYDSASNGNRTRGGMKKASDIINTFRPYFPTSSSFRRASSLLSATHALSFYSLTLQHGVPFQPVSIRVSSDPLSLLDRVLDQNPHSYTKVDDLIDIAQNLVAAGLPVEDESEGPAIEVGERELAARKRRAEQRVLGMAIEASLREDDFETAYSYVVNRLTPTAKPASTAPSAPTSRPTSRSGSVPHVSQREPAANAEEEYTAWRAAFLAGRYHSFASSPPSLRRLEQRLELLSQALLLAPPP